MLPKFDEQLHLEFFLSKYSFLFLLTFLDGIFKSLVSKTFYILSFILSGIVYRYLFILSVYSYTVLFQNFDYI